MRTRAAQRELVVVGADLSLNESALVAVRGSTAEYAYGSGPEVLAVRRMQEQKLRGVERLNAVVQWALRFFDDLALRGMHPAIVMFEGPGFASQVAHSLGQLHGTVKLALWMRGLLLGDVPPSTLKKFLTGAGNADKNVVMKAVFKRWGFDRDDDNECDAYGASLVGLCQLAGGSATQQKAIAGKVVIYARRDEHAAASDGAQVRQVAGRTRRRRL